MTRLTMPQQVDNRAPIGSLLKRPRESRSTRRSGPVLDASHLAAIRQLPCIKCGLEPCGEAAHVRMSSAAHGKRSAMGAKPSDSWSVPLCPACHREDADSQHRIGELSFWHDLGINPLLVCTALYTVSPDVLRMRAIVFTFMAGRE